MALPDLDSSVGHSFGLEFDGITIKSITEVSGLKMEQDVVELALALPPEWKLISSDRPAKWMLRRAFDGWLPDEVLWRRKEQFGQGTGMNDVLREHYEATVTEEELRREAGAVDPPLRTREELAYYRMFAEVLPGLDVGRTIGRFVEA